MSEKQRDRPIPVSWGLVKERDVKEVFTDILAVKNTECPFSRLLQGPQQ